MESRIIALKLVLDSLNIPASIETVDDRKRVQKAIYLGQLVGVPLGYRFGWYLKGPYSPNLTKDYYNLAEAVEMGDCDYKTKKLQGALTGRLRSIQTLLDVPDGVDLPQEDWLELISSLHYLRSISKKSYEEALEVLKREKPSLVQFVDTAKMKLQQANLLN